MPSTKRTHEQSFATPEPPAVQLKKFKSANMLLAQENARLQNKVGQLRTDLEDAREELRKISTRTAWAEMGAENNRVKEENAGLKKLVSRILKEQGPNVSLPSVNLEPIPGSARNPYMASARWQFGYDAAATTFTLPSWAQPTGTPMGTAPRFSKNVSMNFALAGEKAVNIPELLANDKDNDETDFDELMWQ